MRADAFYKLNMTGKVNMEADIRDKQHVQTDILALKSYALEIIIGYFVRDLK
jgi:hypothetical protein